MSIPYFILSKRALRICKYVNMRQHKQRNVHFAVDNSLSQLMVHIWTILVKFTYVWKMCNWNQWKGNIILRKPFSFFHLKIHRNGNWSPTKIFNGECWHLFSIRKLLAIPRTISNIIIWLPSSLYQLKISLDFLYLAVNWNLTS